MKRFLLAAFSFVAIPVAFAQNTVSVDASKPASKISRHIYGHFAEHLGRCIYGGFYVGDTSAIANTAGVRNDVVAALKKMKIPNLRWPGGCFADTYHWMDGVGPKKDRPKIVNRWWGGVTEDNSFGTHDFLNMCELLNTQPYLSGNVGSGTVQELSDWIQYTNFEGEGPMSKLRRDHGRDSAWKVPYWGVGNEAWGCGGNMTAEYYANEYRKYATFMSDWGNKAGMFRIASGASDGDFHWTETLMKNIPLNLIEGVALHHYSILSWSKKGPAVAFSEDEYFGIMKQSWLMDSLVRGHVAIMDKYDPKKRVALVVDEWGGWYDVEPGTNPGFLYQQNTMRDAMIAGMTLNIFNNHSERVRMANLAQAINVLQAVILTDGAKMLLTPTYHVMEMYNVHQDATLIPMTVKSNDYVYNNQKLPAVSLSASKDSAGRIHISLTNIDAAKAQDVTIDLKGISFKSVSARALTSGKLQDHNTFEQPNKITPQAFKGATVKGTTLTVKMPPFSVVVVELK